MVLVSSVLVSPCVIWSFKALQGAAGRLPRIPRIGGFRVSSAGLKATSLQSDNSIFLLFKLSLDRTSCIVSYKIIEQFCHSLKVPLVWRALCVLMVMWRSTKSLKYLLELKRNQEIVCYITFAILIPFSFSVWHTAVTCVQPPTSSPPTHPPPPPPFFWWVVLELTSITVSLVSWDGAPLLMGQ